MSRKANQKAFRRSYLKEWREHRGLTQADVVGRLEFMGGDLPKTAASLSRLENGKQPWSQPILEALAEVYETEPCDILSHNPLKEGEVVDFWTALDAKQRQQVMVIAKALTA